MKKAFFTQRLLAYIIDFLIVYFVLIAFTSILTAMLPAKEKENKAYDDFMAAYEELLNNPSEEVVDNFYKEQTENIYTIEKSTVPTLIFGIIINVGYFGAFQYTNNGQTLGKKVTKIRVTAYDDKKKYGYLRSVIRACLTYGVFSNLMLCILFLICSPNNFLIPYGIVSILATIFKFATMIMIAFKKDGRGLPDLICSTKVEKA
jgi:uncharacterized RDD family membrane protein YckC